MKDFNIRFSTISIVGWKILKKMRCLTFNVSIEKNKSNNLW